MFYFNKQYRKEIMKIMNRYDTSEIESRLMSEMGYTKDTIKDEVAAYLIDGGKNLVTECGINLKPYRAIMLQLLQVYSDYVIRNLNIIQIDK